jgi:hypothetical protein
MENKDFWAARRVEAWECLGRMFREDRIERIQSPGFAVDIRFAHDEGMLLPILRETGIDPIELACEHGNILAVLALVIRQRVTRLGIHRLWLRK